MEKLPTIRETDPVNAAMLAADAEIAARRFEYLVSRRDLLLDRLRFGLLGISGASLVALVGVLAGDGSAALWIGFNPPRIRASAAAFAIGTILAGLSIMIDASLYRKEAGDAVVRSLTINRLRALYEAPFNDTNYARAGDVMNEYHELPLVDFQYSIWSIVLLNASGGAWLFGIIVPLSSALGF